jgi:putative endonuclease
LFVIPVGNLLLHWLLLLFFLQQVGAASLLLMKSDEYCFWVYILASRSRSLYIGMTNNLRKRLATHRSGVPGSHTAKYNIHRLVYFEQFQYVTNAIAREKELKKWTRSQKIALIEKKNPTWEDLAEGIPLGPAYEKQIPCGNDNK